jgi:very-short-patch-repair endonuclease
VAGRKTISLDEIMAKLPSHLKIVEETYQNTQTYATFIDEKHGEFIAKPHDVVNRGRKHPLRNKKRGGGNAPPKYQINDIENKLKELYGDYVKVINDSYKGIGENCQFIIEGKEYSSKPSRILKGKLPVDIYFKKLNEKNILSRDEFEKRLKSIRDDVEILEYSENYKKEKSVFKFKNFNKPVRLLGLSVLNGALHPSERAKKALEVYFNQTGFQNQSQNPEVRKKVFSKQGMSLLEKKINSFLENRNFDFKYNSQLNDKGKFWDFIIFKNDKPKIIIEIDGEFVHGIAQDANSNYINGIKDAERFQNIDEDIIYLQCDSLKIEKLYEEILRVFEIDYHDWLNEIVEKCFNLSFPYPTYNHNRMIRDYKNLCDQKKYNKNFYTGNSIILNFHQSIYSSHRENCLSPLQAWHNRDKLVRCIKNRFIYSNNLSSMSIARGFEKNKIAPRVSVFQPSLARYIIEKYSSDCKTIIDPFSGFSGRMLGASSLNKTYFGFDCRHETFVESLNIKKFLNLENVHLEIKNIFHNDYEGEYDVLLTCPPYENKEIWFNNQKSFKIDYYINLCLTKIKAKKYIFIIDDVETNYQKHFVDYVVNQSHFGKNKEKILII